MRTKRNENKKEKCELQIEIQELQIRSEDMGKKYAKYAFFSEVFVLTRCPTIK